MKVLVWEYMTDFFKELSQEVIVRFDRWVDRSVCPGIYLNNFSFRASSLTAITIWVSNGIVEIDILIC